MKKILPIVPVLLFCTAALFSCTSPSACFVLNTEEDSIFVGSPIIFDAGCSSKGVEYVWEFYTPGDSTIYYDQIVTKTFTNDDTGALTVKLVVLKGTKTGGTNRFLQIRPR